MVTYSPDPAERDSDDYGNIYAKAFAVLESLKNFPGRIE